MFTFEIARRCYRSNEAMRGEARLDGGRSPKAADRLARIVGVQTVRSHIVIIHDFSP